MDKCEKRRFKHVAAHPNSSVVKYDNDVDNKNDNWRKYQGRESSICHNRNDRRQSNGANDMATGYKCSTESYRPRNHNRVTSGGSRNKYVVSPNIDEIHRADVNKNHGILRTFRNNIYPSNVAVVRKPRYKNDIDDAEDEKYAEPDVIGDDNVDDDVGEEIVDEERDNGSEYSDKEYEDQDDDDDVDDESDVLERPLERLENSRKIRVEPGTRNQRTFTCEPSHHRRGRKIATAKDLERCCHTVAERENVDVPTEDDDDEQDVCEDLPYSLKKSAWRCNLSHRDRDVRDQPRNHVDRYANYNGTTSGSRRATRRPRTTRPEAESSMTFTRVPHESMRRNRCSNCGILSAPMTKTTSSRNASCKLRGDRCFIRLPIGDDAECYDDSEPIISYHTKSRRSKDPRPTTYDSRDDVRTMDAEIGDIGKSCRAKISRETSNVHGERTRHSLRVNNRHDKTTSSKNDNRHWA